MLYNTRLSCQICASELYLDLHMNFSELCYLLIGVLLGRIFVLVRMYALASLYQD